MLPSANNTSEDIMGGSEVLSIPRGFVRILSMQLPEYPRPPNTPKGVEISFHKFSSYFMSRL